MIQKEIVRIAKILATIPEIRRRIKRCPYGQNPWNHIKDLCEPLGLTDTAFRDRCSLKDYLINRKYWLKRLEEDVTPKKGNDR